MPLSFSVIPEKIGLIGRILPCKRLWNLSRERSAVQCWDVLGCVGLRCQNTFEGLLLCIEQDETLGSSRVALHGDLAWDPWQLDRQLNNTFWAAGLHAAPCILLPDAHLLGISVLHVLLSDTHHATNST